MATTGICRLPACTDLGLLILRLWLGMLGMFHGAQKVFGTCGGPGIDGFAGFLKSLDIPNPTAAAWGAGLSEFGGGVLVLIGLLARIAAIPFMATMIVAFATAHHGVFDVQKQGGEYPLTIAAGLLVIIVAGPGRYSAMAMICKSGDGAKPAA